MCELRSAKGNEGREWPRRIMSRVCEWLNREVIYGVTQGKMMFGPSPCRVEPACRQSLDEKSLRDTTCSWRGGDPCRRTHTHTHNAVCVSGAASRTQVAAPQDEQGRRARAREPHQVQQDCTPDARHGAQRAHTRATPRRHGSDTTHSRLTQSRHPYEAEVVE